MRKKSKKKRPGIGAKCSIQAKYLRPSKVVTENIINKTKHTTIEDLILVRQERKELRGKEALTYFFRHSSFENISIYANARWVKVIEEGSEDQLFTEEVDKKENEKGLNAATHSEGGENLLPDGIYDFGNCKEDIILAKNLGIDVDDDNEPAVENVPDSSQVQHDKNSLYEGQSWGWDGIDNRSRASVQNSQPRLVGYSQSAAEGLNYLQMFRLFFFTDDFVDLIIEETSKRIEPPITKGEFFRYIGIWLMIVAHTPGGGAFDRRSWWHNSPPSMLEGAPFRLHHLMSVNRFNDITVNLCYTNLDPPSYLDKFWVSFHYFLF